MKKLFIDIAKREKSASAPRGKKLVLGKITPFLADLRLSEEAPSEIAREHRVSPAALQASLEHLEALGLARRRTR